MVQEAEANSEKDSKKKTLIETKNDADSLIYSTD
jgi:hypothetical protein